MTTCSSTTSPTNIDVANIVGTCDLKCNLQIKYTNSACRATNNGDYISLSYDRTNVLPVTYNSISYYVSDIRIYTKSLHTYGKENSDAEIIILHSSDSGATPLAICVPIKVSNNNSKSAGIFNKIISTMSKSAPTKSDTTNVPIDNYNMNYIVPLKPFFTYNANTPFQPCVGAMNFIVFSPEDYTADMSQESYDILEKIVSSNEYRPRNGAKVFYNKDGPNTGSADEDKIYIDCQPVGASNETTFVSKDNSEPFIINWESIKTNIFLQIIIAAFGFLIIFYAISLLLGYFNPNEQYIAQKGGTSINTF